MKNQLRTIGIGMMLAVLPMATVAPAQGTSQGSADYTSNVPTQASTVEAKEIHTVAVNPDGTLVGQVTSINNDSRQAAGLQGLNVFFVRDGQVVQQAQTTSDGSFSVKGLTEGPYSFYAAGKFGFAAYGVYVAPASDNSNQNLLEVTTASTNSSGIAQLLKHRSIPQQVRQSVVGGSPGESLGESVVTSKQVRLINGRLKGEISSLSNAQSPESVQVYLIQNDRPVAQVQPRADGRFIIPDVAPGVYDFVAAGQDSFTAGRFEAVGNSRTVTQISYRRTALQLECCLTVPNNFVPQTEFVDQSIDNADLLTEPSYLQPIEYSGESIAYGGASGGSAGTVGNYSNFSGNGVVSGRFGGGGAGRLLRGGGGLRRLLTLGGLSLGVIALSDDDPRPASPIRIP